MENSEISYLIAQILLFVYSVLTGTVLFAQRFVVRLLNNIFKSSSLNPDEYPDVSIPWLCFVLVVFILNVFFGFTLMIPIAVIAQSSCVLYRLTEIYKTLILENP